MYSLTWGVVLATYSLPWTTLFPRLSTGLFCFIFTTSIISIGLGCTFRRFFYYKLVSDIDPKKIGIWVKVLWGILIAEFLVYRSIPLFGYIQGTTQYRETEFGFPVLHIIMVNGFVFTALYTYYCLRSTIDKHIKIKLKRYLFMAILPPFLLLSRSVLMEIILCIIFIYLLSSKHTGRAITAGCILGLCSLFVFGALGNLRTDGGQSEHLILDIGEATDEFRNSIVPDELFWGYLYIASPMANLQNTINQADADPNNGRNWLSWGVYELMPELVSKRLYPLLSSPPKRAILITDALTVSTVYANSYAGLGWWGMIGMFLFSMGFIFSVMLLVPPSSNLYVPAIISVNMVLFLNLFDNMFIFMGLIPLVWIIIMLNINPLYTRLRKIQRP